jgi:hypothetical protein
VYFLQFCFRFEDEDETRTLYSDVVHTTTNRVLVMQHTGTTKIRLRGRARKSSLTVEVYIIFVTFRVHHLNALSPSTTNYILSTAIHPLSVVSLYHHLPYSQVLVVDLTCILTCILCPVHFVIFKWVKISIYNIAERSTDRQTTDSHGEGHFFCVASLVSSQAFERHETTTSTSSSPWCFT